MVGGTLARYVGVSLVALGADLGSYLLMLRLGLAPVPGAVLAYGLGLIVHWCLSSRAVFAGALAPVGAGRMRQQMLFVGTALVGLAVTAAVVGAGAAAGFDPRLAKLAAIGLSFAGTFVLRNRLVFATRLAD